MYRKIVVRKQSRKAKIGIFIIIQEEVGIDKIKGVMDIW
jgi:hypothetical protein